MADQVLVNRMLQLVLYFSKDSSEAAAEATGDRVMEAIRVKIGQEFPNSSQQDIEAAWAETGTQFRERLEVNQLFDALLEKARIKSGRKNVSLETAVEILGKDDPDLQKALEVAGELELRRSPPEGTA